MAFRHHHNSANVHTGMKPSLEMAHAPFVLKSTRTDYFAENFKFQGTFDPIL
jgi:hypothetical protein